VRFVTIIGIVFLTGIFYTPALPIYFSMDKEGVMALLQRPDQGRYRVYMRSLPALDSPHSEL